MKQAKQAKVVKKNEQSKSKIKITYYFLVAAYLLAPSYAPNFYTLDTNGPKFLAFALLNLISLLVLFTDKDFRQRPEMQSGFFRNFIGLAYILFLAISLVSFSQAINITESVLNFAKLFSVFAASYVLYVIFSSNRAYLLHLAIAMTFVLIFDCFTVFYHISQYISKNVASIAEIKSVYSNKNILAAALFVKIPAALWLMLFTDKWKKILGSAAFLMGVIAVLFMSTRAFYLGLAFLIVTLAAFFIIRHFVVKKNLTIKKVLLFAGFLIIALVSFSLIQRYLYPKNTGGYDAGIVERISTISSTETSTNLRLNNWKRSLILIKQYPLLGVGSGNWKIEVLKYEAPKTENFIISYKNHNDFIEVTAETGIFGGIVYLSIFLIIIINFIKVSLSRNGDEEALKYLFLPTFGIIAYSVDAFFNFPNDRPEIQALFALYIGMAVAFSNSAFPATAESGIKPSSNNKITLNFIKILLLLGIFLSLCASALVLSLNVKSLRYQRYVFEDMKGEKYSYKSDYLIQKFPPIPNISSTGAPITTYIAYYLLKENLINEATTLLFNDNTTPYDSRREYYLSMAYDKVGNMDSVIYWGKKVSELKPKLSNVAFVLSSRLLNAGRPKEALQTMQHFLAVVKTNPDAWLQTADIYINQGEGGKAISLLDSALVYLPDNENIVKKKALAREAEYIKPYEALYNQANQVFAQQRYTEALKLLNDFISKRPDLPAAYQNRALCRYRTGDYAGSLLDIEKGLIKGGPSEAFLINLRGVNKVSLGRTDEACADFKFAMEKGDNDGIINYQRFCEQKK